MAMKNYRHKLTGKVAPIDESIGNHPVLGRLLEEVVDFEFEDENKIVHEVEVDDTEIEDDNLSETETTEEQ